MGTQTGDTVVLALARENWALRHARVVWRRIGRLGIEFVAEARPAAPPAARPTISGDALATWMRRHAS